ncbi:uncharacterized protein LOC134251491 isoform X2 [Saccostrea cucullata]|uniref:uncharacterized protein LOC134251491 isoform X2 n=1 Tax=Saccostrea cuccullata TaxID=36930 RepID=UPI002ED0A4B3
MERTRNMLFISCSFSCLLQFSFLRFGSSQNLQIQAIPQTVDMGEDTLTIICSLNNPSLVKALYLMVLQRNSSNSFENVVSIIMNANNYQEEIRYYDSTLQARTIATGSLEPPSTSELRLTFTKENLRCPDDFKECRCKLSGLDSNSNIISEQDAESVPVQVYYRVQPIVIEMPRVRILGEQFDTNERQFEVGTALQLTCIGQIGSDPSAIIRWCAKTAGAQSFTGLPMTPVHSQASPSGCQYTRSSSITYNLTSVDTYKQFLCESGSSGLCGTGTAIQFLNITLTWSQNLQIQAIPQTVDMGEDTMTIICSLNNPSQVKALYFMELQRNTSNSFENVVSILINIDNYQEEIRYRDSTLQARTTATGSLEPPSTSELRLTFTKENVRCPDDFKECRCKLSGLDNNLNMIPEQDAESVPVQVYYRVQPTVIEMPRVRILGEQFDTNERQFDVGTALQLTCIGQIGSDPSATIRWCAKTAGAQSFTGLPQTPIHSQASTSGCQYTRTSTITYNLTSSDTYTQFLCESGSSGLCGTGTAIQYFNITLTLSPNLQIQVQPQVVELGKDELVIVCSIQSASHVSVLYNIHLQRNTSNGFETVVALTLKDQREVITYEDLTLNNLTTATGSLNLDSEEQLRVTFPKSNIRCPDDFKEYRCKMSGLDSNSNMISEKITETNPLQVSYKVRPVFIETPKVRILREQFDTNERQFEVGTNLQLTCTGQIVSDSSATIRWCAKTAGAQSFTG